MIDTGDTAFIIAAAGLVLLMTPGLALFYGGMVRSKNILGTICLGIFASTAINPGGADGLLAGNPAFWGTQLFGVLIVGAYAFILSWVLLKAVDAVMGLRLELDSEVSGLDLSEHSETAYS